MRTPASVRSADSRKALKKFALLGALCFALFAAACSGGGSNPAPPPPTGNFSNASLKGQYAFSMSGSDFNGEFLARVGSFTADGNGGITGGIEDVNTAGGGQETLNYSSSSYSIQADGRGIINLANQTGTLQFSVTLLSPTQGLIVQTDPGLSATTSGTFVLQTPSAFTASSLSGNYVFDFSGLDFSSSQFGVPDSIIGQFVANGNNGLSSGILDRNNDGALDTSAPFTAASYQMDAVNGPTFGRGTLTFVANGATFNYAFYIVNGKRSRMIQINANALTVGDAVSQSSVPTSNATFNGNFAFLLTGSSTSGALTEIGRFTADGNGGLNSTFADINDFGSVQQLQNSSLSSVAYAIDGNVAGTGRGTLTFTDASLGTFQFVFYLTSPSGGVIQDVSANIVADGSLQLQTGAPFTQAGLAGDYGFNFSGISSNTDTLITAEEDFVGHMALSAAATNNVSGAVDFTEFNSNTPVFLNIVLSGTGLSIGGDGATTTGTRNSLALKPLTSPSATINFVPYIIDSQHMFVAGTDDTRVISGVVTLQNP